MLEVKEVDLASLYTRGTKHVVKKENRIEKLAQNIVG
jgi:hypothetical protein